MTNLSAEEKQPISQIKNLNENIGILAKVIAISIAKEDLLKGKTEKIDKVQSLEIFDLPDKIIALVIGSTPDSVKSLRSKKKAESKKENVPKSEVVKARPIQALDAQETKEER